MLGLNSSATQGWVYSKADVAQLRENPGDLIQQVVAVAATELMNACAIPPFVSVVNQRLGAFDQSNLGIEVRVKEDGCLQFRRFRSDD